MIDIDEVIGWARGGGAIARSHFNHVSAARKADRSLVTQADVEVEQYLSERIRTRYPAHGLMGEELGGADLDREFVWSVDPVDGTGVFLAGLPTWCVSLGLLRGGEPYLGVIYLPVSDDCYWGTSDGQAFWNGNPIAVNPATSVDSNHWLALPSRAHRVFDVQFDGKMRALGSIALHLCCVARGSAIGALMGGEGGGKLWDIAAGLAILHAAGGVAVTLDGQPFTTARMLDGSGDSSPWLATTPAFASLLCSQIRYLAND